MGKETNCPTAEQVQDALMLYLLEEKKISWERDDGVGRNFVLLVQALASECQSGSSFAAKVVIDLIQSGILPDFPHILAQSVELGRSYVRPIPIFEKIPAGKPYNYEPPLNHILVEVSDKEMRAKYVFKFYPELTCPLEQQ